MASVRANDYYEASLRSTWISSPAAASLQVTAVPSNLPTIITASHGNNNETKFLVTGVSGDSPSNFALTGVSVISGGTENLPEGTPLNCIIHEDFFNQYADVVNGDTINLGELDNDPDTPASGNVIFYMKNGVPFVKDSAGTVTQIGFSSNEWIDVPDNTTMDFDLSEPVKKLKFLAGPLAGNRTFTLSNMSEGQVFMIRVMQDGTGNRQPTWFHTASDAVTITIATPGVITTALDLRTGTPVKFTTTGALPTGITAGTQYYWIRTSSTTGNIASSKANAYAGTAITTSSSQSGDHTMNVQILWAGDSPGECSSSKWDYDDFGFVVHDENTVTGAVIAQEM